MGNWKEDLINAKEDVVYLKYNRGEGVTTSVLKKLMSSDKNLNVLYIGGSAISKIHHEILKENQELRDMKVRHSMINPCLTEIVLKNRCRVLIHYISNVVEPSDCFRGTRFDIGVSDAVSNEAPSVLSGCKQKIIILPEDKKKAVKFIDGTNNVAKRNKKPFKEEIRENIARFVFELSDSDTGQNTTMYREKLVSMIAKLTDVLKEVE